MLAGKDGPFPLKILEDMCWCLDEATKAAFRAMAENKLRFVSTQPPMRHQSLLELEAAAAEPDSVD